MAIQYKTSVNPTDPGVHFNWIIAMRAVQLIFDTPQYDTVIYADSFSVTAIEPWWTKEGLLIDAHLIEHPLTPKCLSLTSWYLPQPITIDIFRESKNFRLHSDFVGYLLWLKQKAEANFS